MTRTRTPVVVGAIPARYASQRLPGKALRPLAGKPLIQHVYERTAAASALDRVVVLTDDERIAEAVAGFGGECLMTPADCASGTDRIAWAARQWEVDGVVNVQGDEPLVEPEAIDSLAQYLKAAPGDSMVTLAAAASADDLADPNVVKVVTDCAGYALYFSRSPIPYERRPGEATPLRHVGLYGYQLPALLALADLEPTPLELAESLEQLRALEHGIRIKVLLTETAAPGVDTAEDLARVAAILADGGASS